MEQQDLKHVKCVVRSILMSSPNSVTISEILNDYIKYEGTVLPFKTLGYSSSYDLLNDMHDILKLPHEPNLNSIVQVIDDKKTSHLRELISRQKPKKPSHKTRRHFSSTEPFQQNFNNTYNNFYGSHRNKTHSINYNARGYNFVTHKSLSSPQPKGFVTRALQHDVEEMCRNSNFLNVYSLKCFLLKHKDYKKLKVFNIEEAIQMLKYFIYINNSGVHLKDSSDEIFDRNNTMSRNIQIDTIFNEEEFLSDDDDEYEYDFGDDDDYKLESTVNPNYETANESNLSSLQSKTSNMFIVQNKSSVESTAKTASNTKYTSFDSVNKQNNIYDETLNLNTSNNENGENIDYKKIIASIIVESEQPITVNELLLKFEKKYGYKFPFQKFSCRTCMDYFRLSAATFKLDDPYSTNSVIRLEENQIQTKRKHTIRSQLIDSSILFYPEFDHSETYSLIYEEYLAESRLKRLNHQQTNYSHSNALSYLSSNPYDEYDSDMVLNSMKEKMRFLLSKHQNGILCDEFMDVYANEFGSGFVYNEYGFKSMKDMAYQLPSVFYVKDNDENNQCILYNAHRRNELENNVNDPTEFYKNIPKTVLCNLANFFKKYSIGVDLTELKTLYCSEYGRSYEPTKYGYSSEKHMFESLDKMVEVHNNVVHTINPYAYTHFSKKKDLEDPEVLEDQNAKILPLVLNSALLNDKDICGLNYEYPKFIMRKRNVTVYVAEIYNPSLFYLQMASDVYNLNCFMEELQSFYVTNEEKYQLFPELVQVGLPCTSCFEDTRLWHRAKVIRIVDDLNVQVLYVDYGSVEVIKKSNLRMLEKRFGALPIQSIPCTLFENNTQLFTRSISDYFAEMVDNDQSLEATIKKPILIENTETYVVDLFLYLKNVKFSVNEAIENKFKNHAYETQESVRRFIYKTMVKEKKINQFNDDDKDDDDEDDDDDDEDDDDDDEDDDDDDEDDNDDDEDDDDDDEDDDDDDDDTFYSECGSENEEK